MKFRSPALPRFVIASVGTFLFIGVSVCVAQDSGSGFELHANGKVTASDVGLPVYPGAKLEKTPDNDAAVDMGFTLGDTHFRLVAANYLSGDSASQILDFYRKPLSRFGDVLECDHGKPVGSTKTARSGLTCSSKQDGHTQVQSVNSSDDHELRAGTPQRFRIVGIGEREGAGIRFGLVYVELPKESGARSKAD